jgi:hypothetical protein
VCRPHKMNDEKGSGKCSEQSGHYSQRPPCTSSMHHASPSPSCDMRSRNLDDVPIKNDENPAVARSAIF